jgi:hypothetical protein
MKALTDGLIRVCLLLAVCLTIGCESSEVSMVKNTPFPLDKSISFGKLFDSYKYCKNGNWELMETDRGQKYVEFKGEYLTIEIVKNAIGSDPKLANYLNSFVDYLNSSDFKIDLIAQFTISIDGKSISPSFLGFEYKGKSHNASFNRLYSYIQKNRECDIFIDTPSEAATDFRYLFSKFITINNKNFVKSLFGWNRNSYPNNDEEFIYILNIDKTNFDDEMRTIAITGSIDETNITIKQLKQAGIKLPQQYDAYDFSFLSEISSLNINEHVVKKIPINLIYVKDASRFTSMNFVSRDIDLEYRIIIKKIIPLEVDIHFGYKDFDRPSVSGDYKLIIDN